MTKLQELPLKFLWIWNCNEAEIAVDFYLTDDNKKYQVKGAGVDAFNYDGHLKVCTTDNIDSTHIQKPGKSVYIDDIETQKKIIDYWKNGSGEKRYNETLNQLNKYKESQEKPLFSDSNNIIETSFGKIELSGKQIFDLVFEMEALLEMQKAFRGSISETHIETLLKASTEGFSNDTVNKIREEMIRKGILE